ncbi:hypothetical protein QWT69_14100 [Sporosarcina oncorhynchi]|uniref:Pre-toxin TG domain-containing protein n=1 Tax=Sporosarcina oncorhynchi TaxID=3056444 RepID=A0ABZ0L310_9BACL|nr:hypothetical protein [Sporosarcina sp. T2O-4]WOV86991.1 hypothetical protein QWT69_14100 [Sporosarcina sp. T2O-4]
MSITGISNSKSSATNVYDANYLEKQKSLSSKDNMDVKTAKLTVDTVIISKEAKEMAMALASKSTPSWLDTAKSWASSTTAWLKQAGQFALDGAKAGLDFLVIDDIKTLFNPNSSVTDKGIALVSLFPAGKVVKAGSLASLLIKSGKGAQVTAFEGLGKVLKHNSKGILLDGNSKTGWEHIVKGHITGTIAKKGDTLFPKALGEAQVKNLVMESLEKGKLITLADGTKVYTYNPQKHGISGMTTVVTKDNIIKTSYPTAGTSVIKVK